MANTFQAYSESQLAGNTKIYTAEITNISNDIGSGALSCVIAGEKQWQIFSKPGLFGVSRILSAGAYNTVEMKIGSQGALSARLAIHGQSQ